MWLRQLDVILVSIMSGRNNIIYSQDTVIDNIIAILYKRKVCSVRGRSQLSTFMYSYRAYGGGGGHEASVLIVKC